MSLVYEALQKAGKEKDRQTGTTPVAQVEPPAPVAKAAPPAPIIAIAEAPPNRPSTSYFAGVIACVSIVALAAIVYIVVIATRNGASSPTLPAPAVAQTDEGAHSPVAGTPASTPPAPAQASPALPSPSATADNPPFKLTGIMKLGDKFGAVVNGHVVYEGQSVGGAIIQTIDRDHVTLNIDGHETVIRLF